MTWYVIVKKIDAVERAELAQYCCKCDKCQGKTLGGYFPQEGFPMSIYDNKERAELYAKNWGRGYEVVKVSEIK